MIALVAAAYLAAPMLRPHDNADTAPDVVIYKAQLGEIDRDIARAVLTADEAERARTEIGRRLLAATKDAPAQSSDGPGRVTAGVVLVALVAVSGLIYQRVGAPGVPDQPLPERLEAAQRMRDSRPDQATLVAAAPPSPPIDVPAEYLESVAQLRALMPYRPDDPVGWELLAFHETELGNFGAAALAQARVLALREDGGTPQERQYLLDLMVTAANGLVSPEAETLARTILEQDDQSIAGRYYLGAMHAQNARPDIAFRLWRPLVESGGVSFHVSLAREQIGLAAVRAGVDYTPPAISGPGLDDIAAAQDMSEEDRTAMIGGMVAGLADRLATEGGPASDWARLIRAYGVLGDTVAAQAIWDEARTAFGGDAGAMALIEDAARSAGVAK